MSSCKVESSSCDTQPALLKFARITSAPLLPRMVVEVLNRAHDQILLRVR